MTARVPFALLGVVLLVGSHAVVGSLQRPVVSEPDVERAMDRASAQSQSALRDAATAAARAAARDPVTERADSRYGAVLNRSRPFRDALRVRVYLRVRDNLRRISERRHGVSLRASVPSVDSPSDLRAAKRRVALERAGRNGTSLRVSVGNVTITARRDGQVVGTRTVSPTLVVPTPTLAVHDRVRLFERRLESGPLGQGLGRRLTARLYPVVWARGYAQYEGAPIENVLANRHVALFTNGAILSMQRELFGHSDTAGRYVLDRAIADTALTDALSGIDTNASALLLEAHRRAGLTPEPADALKAASTVEPGHSPEENVTVGVNGTADDAFLSTYAGLGRTLRRTYSARVALGQRVAHLGSRRTRTPRSPGPNWTLVDTVRETDVAVSVRENPVGGDPVGDEYHRLARHSRTVVRTHTTRRHYDTPDGPERTTGRTVERSAVTFVLAGNHSRGPAPVRPIDSVHEEGGPLNGTNLADVPGLAHRQLVGVRGGVDVLARRATAGEDVSATGVVFGARPSRLDEWVYADLVDLRERVRNVSMTTTRGELATFQTNPPAVLAARLRERRGELVGAPPTYPNVAQRARVAARSEYLETVIEGLTWRARMRRASEGKLRDALSPSSGDSLQRLQEGYDRRHERDPPGTLDGMRLRVDAEPAYLTRSSVPGTAIPAIPSGTDEHPLATRNWNVISVPYGDIADAIVSAILGPDKTRLSSGGQVLRALESANGTVAGPERTLLHGHVEKGTVLGGAAARSTLAAFDLGDEAGRRDAVGEALSRWNTTGGRALAVSNGSFAAAVHEEALERWGDQLAPLSRDLLALRLERNVRRASTSDSARPPEPIVNETANAFRAEVRERLKTQLGETLEGAGKEVVERIAGRTLSRLPAGLPVAPIPGLWYATVNLWQVDVAGEYARFTVRAPRGTPDTPGAQFRYVRDAGSVRLDVDGDGSRELLGRATRISFRTGTDVAIAVPPGPQGVGDVDGQVVEESAGWPSPGPAGSDGK